MLKSSKSTFTTNYNNSKILDYRDPSNPNNSIVLTCEHGFNNLPKEYSWTPHDKENFSNQHWSLDIGAFKMAKALAKDLQCVFVYALYSRLLIDTNRCIAADTLFRKSGDGMDIEMNKDMTFEEENRRIKEYYIPYYEALREVSNEVDPQYIFSIHSFTPLYEGQPRSTEIGVLHSMESVDLALDIQNGMRTQYVSELNKPYDGRHSIGALNSLVFAKPSSPRQGLTLEYRNDILSDSNQFKSLESHSVDVIKSTCNIR